MNDLDKKSLMNMEYERRRVARNRYVDIWFDTMARGPRSKTLVRSAAVWLKNGED